MNARRSWTFLDGMLLAGMTALAVFVSWGVWADIFSIGLRQEEQSHVLLAPAIVAWLIWVRRERLRYTRPAWTLLGPLTVVVGWALAWWGFSQGHQVFWHFGGLLIVGGAALTVLGLRMIVVFFPAVLTLLFLLPVPGRVRTGVSVPLQEATAHVTQWLLELFSVPVTRSGSVLTINGQDVAVAEACNGMRMVAALGLVSVAFVFSTPMRNSVRVVILAMAPLIALVCNVLRLVPTVLLYGYADSPEAVERADAFHDISGWGMLFVALGMLWLVLGALRWLEVPISPYAVAEE